MKKILAALALASTCAAASASLIFSETFDAQATGLNITPTGFTVQDGTVDVVGPGFFNVCGANHGNCVDLDGSSNNAGVLIKTLFLNGGTHYTATFELAGDQRGGSETGTVSFGDALLSYTLPSAEGFSSYALDFTPGKDGLYTLSFANDGGDNIGALLDNIKVNAQEARTISEPAERLLVLASLGLLGVTARRKPAASRR